MHQSGDWTGTQIRKVPHQRECAGHRGEEEAPRGGPAARGNAPDGVPFRDQERPDFRQPRPPRAAGTSQAKLDACGGRGARTGRRRKPGRAGTGDRPVSEQHNDEKYLAHSEMLRAEIEGIDGTAKALAATVKRYSAGHRKLHGQPPSKQALRELTNRTAAAGAAKARTTAKITTEEPDAGTPPAAGKAGGSAAAGGTDRRTRGATGTAAQQPRTAGHGAAGAQHRGAA